MAQNKTYRTLTIGAGGTTTTFPVADAVDLYVIKASGGAVVLAGNVSISDSGTPVAGTTTYTMVLGGGFTLGGNTFSVFGTSLTAAQCLYKQYIVAHYNESASWDVYILRDSTSGQADIIGGDIVAATVTNAALAGSIALTKIASLAARGYALRGGVNGVIEAFNAVTAGQVIMGNGTDVVSQALSGAITLNGSGVATIANNYITQAMLAYTPMEYYEASLTISTASILTLNGTPITIVAAPGAGKYIEVISASATMTYVSAAYATNTTLQLICSGADVAQLQDTSILISTVTKNTRFRDVTPATAGQTQIIANAALQVKVATGNPTLGDSGIEVKVIYRIVTM